MPLKSDRLPNLGRQSTTSDVILKYIRESITDGTLDEGEPIRQDDVAKLFNVSKIPVREALKRLESEGLVEFQHHRGAIVTSVSEPEIAQIFEVRALLESEAIRLSVPNMTNETLQRAEAFCEAFAGEADIGRWAQLNWQFHSCLYEDAERPYLMNMIRSVNDRLERYLRVQLALSDGHRIADNEHRHILQACSQYNVELASELVRSHIMAASQSLLHHLPRRRHDK